MTSLAHVLAASGPGAHRWRSRRPIAEIQAEAAEIGWRCVLLDGSEIRNKEAFLEACERSYRFPAWFGHNWDALADCLADLSWLPPPAHGCGILTVFDSCDGLARSEPAAYGVVLEVWGEVAEAWRRIGVPFTVLLRESPDTADDSDASGASDSPSDVG